MPENFQGIAGWVIGGILASVSSLVASIIAWIKAAKMMPKEIKGTDLDNKAKEVSVAEQFEELAEKAVEKSATLQIRMIKLEEDQRLLQQTVLEQTKEIEKQNRKISLQDKKIKEQSLKISCLNTELRLAKAYNLALIQQIKGESLTPLKITDDIVKEYEKKIEDGANGKH